MQMLNNVQAEQNERIPRRRSWRQRQRSQGQGVPSARDLAKRAVDEAAVQALQLVSNCKSGARGLILNQPHSSPDSSERSEGSFFRRGSRRDKRQASQDDSDNIFTVEQFLIESDLTQRKETEKTKRKASILRKLRLFKINTGVAPLASEFSDDAWMCGVCGKSFSQLGAAQRHEDNHIREVVAEMGFEVPFDPVEAPDNTFIENTQAQLEAQCPVTPGNSVTIERDDTIPLNNSTRTPASSQPRPDMLHTSSANLRFFTKGTQPFNTPALQRKRKSRKQMPGDMEDSSHDDFGGDDYDFTTSILKPSSFMSPIAEHKRQASQRSRDRSQDSRRNLSVADDDSKDHDLLMPHGLRNYVVLVDEALVDVCKKAKTHMLTDTEKEAELELEYLAKDKAYYDMLDVRGVERQREGGYSQFRTEGKTILNKIQNKFVDAYQLMKEGKGKGNTTKMDFYNRKLKGDLDDIHILKNNTKTVYVNVIVKASLKVVSYELQRLAKLRWEADQARKNINDPQAQRFQQFRTLAQENLVKLAGMALAADFTPRRIAIQLSNDLYRLLTPRLKRRGISIETEIEYRVGPYFVLAVNIERVDWRKLVKAAYRDLSDSKIRWQREQNEKKDDEQKADDKPRGVAMSFLHLCYDLTKLTKFEVLAQFFAWCYNVHWALYTPICFVLYHTFLGELFRMYFLATVSDEIFYYVEQKGMEMDIDVRNASTQAAFMLAALREIRADGRELKKKQQQEGEEKASILGPLLGPAIKEDKTNAPEKPPDFEEPENLEYVGLELEIPVGFRRLRWALLSSKSSFVKDAIFSAEAKYENITVGPWSKHDDEIGLPVLPDGVKEEDLIGAEKEASYLMPKSAFVKANMCYETSYIDAYNDYCFVLRKKALTPEVPYGSTFVAWTKYVVINTGFESCRLTCSVEAEFPNGPPMVSRQIKGGMRAGVGELFVKTGEAINNYADQFP